MPWMTLIPLIATHGLPWVYEFWKIIRGKTEPTEEDWQKLLAISQKPLSQYIAEAQARADG